ncbi:helix-turn-helix transcriptional regulator [Nonomuraea sp. NPDC048916]|uniref:helix-turn-helix transcriptional regulator n=1 Tax=Nonomuraea sp. NPDC048916 TaxID=3154232 RepID=UPI00340415B0
MTNDDLVRIARVRRLYRVGEARAIREEADVSQGEFAAALGVSRSAVALWEAGQRNPRGAVALRCAALFDVLKGQAPKEVTP